MALLSKEQFEAKLQNDYDNLTKQDFGALMNASRDKISKLIASNDIVLQKDEETDEIVLVSTSQTFYEIAFGAFQFAARTRKLSFKQYKCLSALVNFKPQSSQEQFKQF